VTKLPSQRRNAVASGDLFDTSCIASFLQYNACLSKRKSLHQKQAAKGVKHGKLTVTTTGKDLPS
jgi:hypothetical protein